MARGVRSLDPVQAIGHRPVAAGFRDEPCSDGFGTAAYAIDLGPVAGGYDQRLGKSGQSAQGSERARQPRRVEHDVFAHLDRRGAVIQSEDKERHDVPAAEIRRIVR